MGGEHLPLSNYDSLTVEEIKDKLTHLVNAGSPISTDAIRSYEKSSQNRQTVLSFLDSLDGSGEVVQPSNETPATGHEDEDKQGQTLSDGKKET